jgi:hypothetical protein
VIATERRKPVVWTAEEEAELKRIYAISIAGRAARAIHELAKTKGISAAQVRRRARTLGFARVAGEHRPWTQAERENLRAYVGRLPVYRIAKILARSPDAVDREITRQRLSRRVRERGYTKTELADLLGVDRDYTLKVMLGRWPMKSNLFGNFSQEEVQLWIWEHLEEIELRKCNQPWLKGLLKEVAA